MKYSYTILSVADIDNARKFMKRYTNERDFKIIE